MALVGGGGAGNTLGSNPSGTGTSVNYIGTGPIRHCYAYSGVITDASSAASSTALKFTTGNSYIQAKLTITNDEASTAAIFIEAFMNGEKVMDQVSDSAASSNPYVANPYYLLIPPYTEFELKLGANASVDFTAWLTGRVYD
jgi:hypothetical protein